MRLVSRPKASYRKWVRAVFALMAGLALLVSGIHAGPAEAHENDVRHIAEHVADAHDDTGSSQPEQGGDHGFHHHCPSIAVPLAADSEAIDYPGDMVLTALAMNPLVSTTRAPPLDPPKA